MTTCIHSIGLLLLIASSGQLLRASRPGAFTVIGPGGGGAMFNPTTSPHDPNTVLVSCDMTGAYITYDGGNSWRMFSLRSAIHFFGFDPVDPKTIYAGTQALWRSSDAGETWNVLYPKASAIGLIRMNSDHADEAMLADRDLLGTIVAPAVDPRDAAQSWQPHCASDGRERTEWLND